MLRPISSVLSLCVCLLTGASALGQSAPAAPAASAPASAISGKTSEISGSVKSGNIPLPGVTIIAANSLTGKKIVTSTGVDGTYSLNVSSKGRYVVRAELPAFAAATKEIVISAETLGAKQRADFEMMLLSRAQKQEQQQGADLQQQIASAVAGRGFQSLGLTQGADAAAQIATGDTGGSNNTQINSNINPDSATESVSISGNMGRTENFGFDPDQLQERIQEMRARGEIPGGGGPGGGDRQFGGGGGFGGGGPMIFTMGGGGSGRGMRGFNMNQPHGAVFYNFGNSALDARPFSLTGTPSAQAGYSQSRFGGMIGGPLKIPHVYDDGGKTFYFLNYFGTKAQNPYDIFARVPTAAERAGDFSQTFARNGSAVQITDPSTGLPFANSTIPQGRIDPAAQALLQYFPLPNQPGSLQNYHRVSSTENDSHNVNFRLVHNFGGSAPRTPRSGNEGGGGGGRGFGGPGGMFGARNSLNIGLNYRTSSNDLLTYAPSIFGSSDSSGWNGSLGYVRAFGKITSRTNFNINANHIETGNVFQNKQDIIGALGINGVSRDPFDWGVPTLQFTNYGGLRDINPTLRDDLTWTVSENMSWNHKKHNLRFGGDFRRIAQDIRSNSNPRGSYLFTGFATAAQNGTTAVQGTGYDFADFLLGLPQQTSAQFGTNTYQFRGNGYNFFVQDDWRVRSNLTLNLGLRYEYVSPYREAHNRLVNLDVAPDFVAVAPVEPGQSGPYSGAFPVTLVNPDRNNFAPRVGIAWSAFKKTVFRAGYGVNYNNGAYASFLQQLAYQPPFSFTETNLSTLTAPLTLQNGFPAPNGSLTNNYGIDRNYRLGYVQTWNADVQRELPWNIVMNVGYTGAKGTHLDMERAPNRGPSGLRIAGVEPFLWQTSEAASILHSGNLRVRKRLQHGISLGGTYTYSKSIDNASTIGGGTVVVAQNDLDLAAERGLSSFDQRHRFTADYVYELPFGTGKHWLNSGNWVGKTFGDWMFSGSATIASGNPFTARVLGDFTDVARGTNGTLRADATGLPISGDGSITQFFNTAAFTVPPSGQFGNAGRNTIIGPGAIDFDLSLSKTIPIKDMRAFEFRAGANNVFNHPNFSSIDTTVNSPTFGQVISVGSMRRVQIQTRFRF